MPLKPWTLAIFFLSALILPAMAQQPSKLLHPDVQTPQGKTERFAGGRIAVPPGYKYKHVVGPDFDVDSITPADEQLNKPEAELGVYIGSFPPFRPPARGVKIRRAHFGNRRIKWHIWKTSENKTIFHYEALIRLKGGQWVWYLFMAAPDMQRMRELMTILKSYRAL